MEIERKFLVDMTLWRPRDDGTLYRQGYLSSHAERTVRVRLEGTVGKLTIKGKTSGISRIELEYPMPSEDAELALAQLCERPLIEKRRYKERHGPHTWEIDVFLGANAGLVIAEIELGSEGEAFERPAWVGREVSDDPRYYNANLVAHPYRDWRTA